MVVVVVVVVVVVGDVLGPGASFARSVGRRARPKGKPLGVGYSGNKFTIHSFHDELFKLCLSLFDSSEIDPERGKTIDYR